MFHAAPDNKKRKAKKEPELLALLSAIRAYRDQKELDLSAPSL
jgi:hypothetical protein